MAMRFGDTLRNIGSSLADRLTNSSVIPEGEELYDHSPLANTYEVIEAERRANGSFRSSLERVAGELNPGFTLDDVTFGVEKPGSGVQQFISTHYSHALKPGFVGIFRGDYKIYDDKVTRTAKGDYSPRKLAEIFLDVVRNNLRLSIPRGVAQEISEERKMSYPHIEGILSDAFSAAKLANPRAAEDIEEVEKMLTPGINIDDLVKNCIILKVVPFSKVKKVLFYNVQQATYKIREINPATAEKVVSDADPFELAKSLMNPSSPPSNERDAIAMVIEAYVRNNPNKSILVLTDPDEERANNLGEKVGELIGKAVPVEMIVSDRPLHHKKVYTVQTPQKSNKRYVGYAATAAASAGILFLAYRGLFPNKFVHHHYGITINGSPVEGNESQITQDSEISVTDNGKTVLTHNITTEKKEKENGKKKKKGRWW